ncbi:Clp protease N-terminal domain-containing protein [Mucilaginibacter ginsenosidivorans]|nr:Clp protease N-terminal domain-containing protein [Mucilaginibacter ginsenosidivorans]
MEAKFALRVKNLVQVAKELANEVGNAKLESEHFLLAFIKDPLNIVLR